MKKTIFTLSLLGIMGLANAQSGFGAKDVIISDFDTKTGVLLDSMWVDTLKTTPVVTPSVNITVADNPYMFDNESAKAAKYIRPKGKWKTLYIRFDNSIIFSQTPYLHMQVYPVKGKSPLKSTAMIGLLNDKGELNAGSVTKTGLAQDEWNTVTYFLGKRKSSSKYNTIVIYINPEDSTSNAETTEYYIDQIGFKAPADGVELPATVFYETFGVYHDGWSNGKLAGMPLDSKGKVRAECGTSELYTSIKGFTSGIPFKFLNADTLAIMQARVWGMGCKYEAPSGDGRIAMASSLPGALTSGTIDVNGYSDLKVSFGIGTQLWWAYDAAIANARPKVEVSVNGAPFYEIYSEGPFLKATGNFGNFDWGKPAEYEDQIFTLVEYPITTEDGNPLTNPKDINIRISYKAGASFWIDDLWFAGKYSGVPGAVTANKSDALVVYPNPATEVIYVNGAQKVTISDLNGRLVKEAVNTEKVDVSTLANGIYVVKVEKDGKTQISKLIKK